MVAAIGLKNNIDFHWTLTNSYHFSITALLGRFLGVRGYAAGQKKLLLSHGNLGFLLQNQLEFGQAVCLIDRVGEELPRGHAQDEHQLKQEQTQQTLGDLQTWSCNISSTNLQ